MPEANPYESPKSEQPLKPGQIVKRGLGVATILLLTPVAVAIATRASCAATMLVVDALPGRQYALAFVVGWLVFLVPPILVLAGMVWWARRTYLRNAGSATKNPGRDDRG